ncbi:MAG: hypothetical protein ACR2K0_08090 [Acidimicrobiales bacterium]
MTDPTLGPGPNAPRPGSGEAPSPYAKPDPESKRFRAVALGVGAVAIVAAGVFAAVTLSGSDGSASPEEAVERLFAAVSDEDIIGVLESLPPGERSALRPGLEDLADELRRLGLISEDLDLGAVGGVDFEVEGLTLASEELGTGVSAVRITGGTITSSIQPDELPIGSALSEMFGGPDGEGPDGDLGLDAETTTEDLASDDAVILAIEEGGGWHVSLFYSVAESARSDTGVAVPAFGQGVEPQGAESPEAAVRGVLDAILGLDARRLVAFTPPDEMRALHDYAPLFLGEAEEAAAELREQAPFDINIDRLDLEPEVDGDVAQVRLAGFEASGTIPLVGPFSASYDGNCFSYEAADTAEEFCTDELQPPGSPFSQEFVVTTVRRDGEWYLSPTLTVFEQVLRPLRALEPEDVENLESLFGPMSGFFGMGMGMGMGAGLDSFSGEVEVAPPQEVRPAPDAGSAPPDAGSAPPAPPFSLDCFAPLEELASDASADDIARAGEEVERCLDDVPGN